MVLLLLPVMCDKVLQFVQLLHIPDQVIPGHAHPLQHTHVDSDFQSRRTGELAFHDKFLFPNTGTQRVVIKHVCPQFGCWSVARWPAIPGGSRPDDRSVLPRGDEKIGARPPTPGTVRASMYKSSGWPVAGPPQCQPHSEP